MGGVLGMVHYMPMTQQSTLTLTTKLDKALAEQAEACCRSGVGAAALAASYIHIKYAALLLNNQAQ